MNEILVNVSEFLENDGILLPDRTLFNEKGEIVGYFKKCELKKMNENTIINSDYDKYYWITFTNGVDPKFPTYKLSETTAWNLNVKIPIKKIYE